MRKTLPFKPELGSSAVCSGRYVVLFLAGILTIGFLLRVLCFAGISPNDDEQYAWLAHQIAQGEFQIGKYQGPPVWPLRVGLLIPVAAAFEVAGTTELAAIFFPFLYSMLSILLAFCAGRVLLGQPAGLVAALIQAMIPIDVRMASWLLPDAMAAFWANVGVVLLWCAINQSVRSKKVSFSVSSGLALGMSWLCKETIFYLFPFIALFLAWQLWWCRSNLIVILASAGAFLFIFFGETLTYYFLQNDALFRLHETERNYEMTKSWFFTEGSDFGWKAGGYWAALVRRLFIDGPRAILFNENFGFVTTTAVMATIYLLIHRGRSQVFLALWFVSVVIMFNFGSSSLKAYQPIVLFDRYLYPVLFPAALLTAWFITVLFTPHPTIQFQRERFFWGSIVSMSILAAFSLGIYRYAKEGINSSVQRSVANMVGPNDIIYSDSQTPMVLNFLWQYPPHTHFCNLRGLEATQVPRGAYVLLDKKWAAFANSHYGDAFPDVFRQVPDAWSIKWADGDGVLYSVDGDAPEKQGGSSGSCVRKS